MERGRDSSKEQVVQHMFMCSKLYVAAFEGRTELVARLLTGSSGLAATAQAMNGTSNLTLQTIFSEFGQRFSKIRNTRVSCVGPVFCFLSSVAYGVAEVYGACSFTS